MKIFSEYVFTPWALKTTLEYTLSSQDTYNPGVPDSSRLPDRSTQVPRSS